MDIFIAYKQFFTVFHVLAVVVGMGAAISTDFLFGYYSRNKKLSQGEVSTIRFLSMVVTYALVGIVLTGITVFLSNPEKYLNSAKFLTKSTIVAILCLNGYLLHHFVFKHISDKNYLTSQRDHIIRRWSFAFGSVSVVSWLGAMTLGVFDRISISYQSAITVYIILLSLAIAFSQIVLYIFEHRKSKNK